MTIIRSSGFRKFSAVAATLAITTIGAQAADLPRKAPVYKAPVAVYDWTGFYAGVFTGVGVNESRGSDPNALFPGETNLVGAGFTGGVTAGYNWQLNPHWVAGIEADIGYFGLRKHPINYDDSPLQIAAKASWLGTIRGRFGYSTGPTLSYVTGGAAFVGTEDVFFFPGAGGGTTRKTVSGYVIGSGVETKIGGAWSAKSESLFVGAGSGDTGTVIVLNYRTDKHRYLTQRFGLNYHFNDGRAPVLTQANWNGFYAGVLGGGGTNQTRIADPTGGLPGEFGNHGNGVTLGALAGYNWQIAPKFIAGVEGDFSWLGVNHDIQDYDDTAHFAVKTHWMATLRGRLGYSTGPALLYATAGGAWLNVNETFGFLAAVPGSGSKTLSGLTVGGGIESLLGNNWTSRNEYLFIDARNGNTLRDGGGRNAQGEHQFHVFRSALIYNFNGH